MLMKQCFTFIVLILFVFQSCFEPKRDKEIVHEKIVKTAIPSDEIVDELYEAIDKQDMYKVKQMLDTSFPAVFLPKNKISPLQAVIWAADNVEMTKLFVEDGADIKKSDESYAVISAEYNRLEILKYLVEKGIDIKSNNAFNKAGFHQHYEVAKFLLLKGANQELGDIRGKLWVYEQAVRKSDYQVLDALQLSKDDVDATNCDGETALLIAVKQNNSKMVEYLIKNGADKSKPETFDCGDDISFGKTPLEIAQEKAFQDLIPLLQ